MRRRLAPKDTASQVANHIRAGIKAIVDPHPTVLEENLMWSFFENLCAYCGVELVPGTEGAHRDHLISKKFGGLNHVSNRVPACSDCNGNKKREKDWREFLQSMNPGTDDFQRREAQILAWLTQWSAARRLSERLLELCGEEAGRVIDAFKQAVDRLRHERTVSQGVTSGRPEGPTYPKR